MEVIILHQVERILIVLAGLACLYWGYRLFAIATKEQGEFSARQGERFQLSLKNVAPGIWFAMFGTAVLIVAFVRPVEISVPNGNSSSGWRTGELPGLGGRENDGGEQRESNAGDGSRRDSPGHVVGESSVAIPPTEGNVVMTDTATLPRDPKQSGGKALGSKPKNLVRHGDEQITYSDTGGKGRPQ